MDELHDLALHDLAGLEHVKEKDMTCYHTHKLIVINVLTLVSIKTVVNLSQVIYITFAQKLDTPSLENVQISTFL